MAISRNGSSLRTSFQPIERPTTRSRRLVHRKALSKNKFVDEDKRKWSVVPVRFVRACRAGHIGDINWRGFVHAGSTPSACSALDGRTRHERRSFEVLARCECEAERSMIQAVQLQNIALGHCDGSRPWLGPYTKETCGEPSRLLIRTASNAYFPQLMSVISLPDRDETVKMAVDAAGSSLRKSKIWSSSSTSGRKPR